MRKLIRELSKDQLRAGIAAVALFLTLFLPWYRITTVRGPENLSAFEVFSFVEAAVLLVAAAVLYLLYARAQGRAFHLPGGDGWAITLAGGWVVFLLVWRFFDKPDVDGPVGIQWGAFVALAVGAALAAAGQRLRIAHEAEPPNPAEDPTWETPRRPRPRGAERAARRPVDAQALTRVLRDERPNWDGEPPEPPSRSSAPEPTSSPRPDPHRDAEGPATRSSSPTRPLGSEAEPPPPPPPPADESDRSARPTRRLGPAPPDDDDDDALF